MENYNTNIFKLDIESILNSNYTWHGDIDKFFKKVKATGYPYFLWNGAIYKVNDYQEGYERLNLTIEDIRKRDLISL